MMNGVWGRIFIVGVMGLLLPAPLAGTAGQLPVHFGIFPPPYSPRPIPGFNWGFFLFALTSCLILASIVIWPYAYGFKRPPADEVRDDGKRGRLPGWFWAGLAVMVPAWWLMWAQPAWAGELLKYTFVPVWWGLIFALDGVTYYRTAGHSLVSDRPGTLAASAVVSLIGWYMFEYLNYFAYSNWYYPVRDAFSTTGYLVWFGLAYTTVWPAIFQWYTLLNTFPAVRQRYQRGPASRLSRSTWWGVLALGVLMMVLLGRFPHEMFFALWLGPLFGLWAALELIGVWHPLVPVRNGDWRPIVLMIMATFCNGLVWEIWNGPTLPNNPNFWGYAVPYVDVGVYIGEMPLLGLFGYFPFGIFCWVFWLAVAHVMGWSPQIGVSKTYVTAGRPDDDRRIEQSTAAAD